MQTQWPALGPTIDFSSLDASAGWNAVNQPGSGAGPFGAAQPDAIARPWWTCGTAAATQPGGAFGGAFGGDGSGGNGVSGLLSGLLSVLQQLVGALLNGASPAGTPPNQGPAPSTGATGYEQPFSNVDVSSTGDPHIAEVGTSVGPGGGGPVDVRWDSMTGHDDLVHSNQIEGGYRVSTAVTTPDANGVTYNQSATVHTNFDQAAVTMNRDGSYSIFDNLNEVALGKGESATLSGGETVTANQDGSLTVGANNGGAGSIATTLRSTGAGVDVTTHAQGLALGGDAITHGAPKGRAVHAPHARPAHHHRKAAAPNSSAGAATPVGTEAPLAL
jgi:hypothetical protein